MAQGSTGHIHGHIAHADDRYGFSELVRSGIGQVRNAEMYIGQAFTFNAQRLGAPDAGGDKDRGISVAEKIFDGQRFTECRIGAEENAHSLHQMLIPGDQGLGKTEIRNAVFQHAADLIVVIKHGDVVSILCQLNGGGQPRRAGTDDSDFFAFLFDLFDFHAVKVGIGNKTFNIVERDRCTFVIEDTVSCALCFMVTDDGADDGHRIVVKKHLACFHQTVFLERPDGLRNRGMDGTTFLAHGFPALEATVGFCENAYGHEQTPS